MSDISWAENSQVHEVELHYVPGIFHEKAYATAEAQTMWGGLACAILEPFPQTHELVLREGQRGLFDTVFKTSSHAAPRRLQFVRNLLRKLSEI